MNQIRVTAISTNTVAGLYISGNWVTESVVGQLTHSLGWGLPKEGITMETIAPPTLTVWMFSLHESLLNILTLICKAVWKSLEPREMFSN